MYRKFHYFCNLKSVLLFIKKIFINFHLILTMFAIYCKINNYDYSV